MLNRFSIARKAYHIIVAAGKTISGFAGIGFMADFDCHVSAIEDIAFQLLVELFPEVDESFFTQSFFETTEMATEEEFLKALEEELAASKVAAESEDKDKNEDKENKKVKARVITVKYTPSADEINDALRKLFGM